MIISVVPDDLAGIASWVARVEAVAMDTGTNMATTGKDAAWDADIMEVATMEVATMEAGREWGITARRVL